MKKDGDLVIKEEISFLNQLITSIEETEIKLIKEYENENIIGFERAKEFMLKLQNKMSEVLA